MIDPSSAASGNAISPGTRRILDIDPIEGTDGVIDLTAVYRHLEPADDQFAVHTFRFRHTVNRQGEYLLGLDEWCPPDRPVSAQHLGMLTYLAAYFASYGVHVSMAVPVFEPGNRADDSSAERFTNDAELRIN